MFDVPSTRRVEYVAKERNDGSGKRRANEGANWVAEKEDKEYWFEKKGLYQKFHIAIAELPSSELLLVRSDRRHAYHTKMTAKQLRKHLEFFKFDTAAIVRLNLNKENKKLKNRR